VWNGHSCPLPLQAVCPNLKTPKSAVQPKSCQAPQTPIFRATLSFYKENKLENHGTFTLFNLLF